MPAHSAPASMPASDRQRQVQRARQVDVDGDPARRRAGEQHLAATADVEHAGPERQPDAQPGRDQRPGELQGLGERADARSGSRRPGCCRSSRGTGRCRRPRWRPRTPGRSQRAARRCSEADSRTSSSVSRIISEPTTTARKIATRATVALPVVIERQTWCQCPSSAGRGCVARPRASPGPRGRPRRAARPVARTVARRAARTGLGGVTRRLRSVARRSSSGPAPRGGCRPARSRRSDRGRAP